MADPIAETEALYKQKLPDEYKAFLKDKLYKKYDNQFSSLLEGGRDTQQIRFVVGSSLFNVDSYPTGDDFSFADNLSDLDEEVAASAIPFAAFDADGEGEIDSGALFINVKLAKGGKCPVFIYDDSGVEEVAESIKEFLESLSKEPAEDSDDDEEESGEDE